MSKRHKDQRDGDLMEFLEENAEKIVATCAEYMETLKPILEQKGMAHALSMVYGTLDNINKYVDSKATFSCGVGCSACCHTDINLTKSEVEYVKLYMKEFNVVPNDRLKVQQGAKVYSDLKWAQQGCSLLGDDGKCTVYVARPIICRIWNSISPAENCGDNEQSSRVARTIEGHALVLAVKELDEIVYANNKPTGLYLHEEL
jgi:Fe-S-cluster containining protein